MNWTLRSRWNRIIRASTRRSPMRNLGNVTVTVLGGARACLPSLVDDAHFSLIARRLNGHSSFKRSDRRAVCFRVVVLLSDHRDTSRYPDDDKDREGSSGRPRGDYSEELAALAGHAIR